MDVDRVALAHTDGRYGARPPFDPPARYPESPLRGRRALDPANAAYAAVRESLRLLELDAANYDTAEWNPLGEVVRPGDTVVLKPNLVRDFHESDRSLDACLTTHGALIRAVADFALLALQGRGRLILCDAPQNDADFDALRRRAGLDELAELYRVEAGFSLEVYDLRPERAHKIDGVIVGHEPLPGDPAGYARVDLGAWSAFVEVQALCDRLYGSEYDTREIRARHTNGVHEYLVSKTVLSADALLSLPKLKTHKKVGLTVNLKNLVGINGNKNWLPHYRVGAPADGGDQFAGDSVKNRVEGRVVGAFKRVFPGLGRLRSVIARPLKGLGKAVFGDTERGAIRSGNWHGNDTAWRMTLDLGRVALFADAEGRLHDAPVRRYFSVVDGIVAGEGNGPLAPTPRAAGLVIAGADALAVDLVCARVMGFDDRKIPLLRRGFERGGLTRCQRERVTCVSNHAALTGRAIEIVGVDPPFEPHSGWRGAIERERTLAAGGNR